MQRFLARIPRLVADFQPAQPLDAGHALHARHHQPQRVTVLRPQHLAVLPVHNHHIVEREFDRDRARQRRTIGALREDVLAARLVVADLFQQRRQQNPGELAAGQHSVRVLHGRHCDVAPLHAAVGSALDEVHARHGRKTQNVIHRQDQRAPHQSMDHQPVLVRIDFRRARVMPLEVNPARRDDAEQVLQRSEADGGLWRSRQAGTQAPLYSAFEFRRQTVPGDRDAGSQAARP